MHVTTSAKKLFGAIASRPRPRRANLIAAAAAIAAAATLAAPAAAQERVWTGTTGNFGLSTNWSGADVPDTNGEFATLNNGGTIEITADHSFGTWGGEPATGGFFTITNGTVTQTAGNVSNLSTAATGSNPGGLNVGLGAGTSGTYSISGGTLNTGTPLVKIGDNGNGAVNLSGSAAVTSGGGLRTGNGATSVALITLADSASWAVTGGTTLGQNATGSQSTLTIGGTSLFSTTGNVTVGNSNATGTVNLNGGTLSAGAVNRGSGTAVVNFNGGTVQARANQTTNFFGGFTATNAPNSQLNVLAGGLRFDTNTFNATISQSLSGDGGVTKLGAGMLTMTGTAATYAGGTTVAAGQLTASPGSLGSGAVTVQPGAQFRYDGNNTANFTQPFRIAGNGTGLGAVRFGAVGPVGVTLSGGVTLTADAQIGTTSSNGNDITISTNNIDLATHTLTVGAPTILSGTYTVSSNVVSTGGGGAVTFTPMNPEANLVLSGTNSYAGPTTAVTGTVLVNGSHTGGGAFEIGSAGGLGGGGTIQSSGVTLDNGARLTPGPAFQTLGTTTLALGAGSLDLSAAETPSTFFFDLDAPGTSDTVALTSGLLNLGTLNFEEFAFNPQPGFGGEGTYTLFDASSTIVGSIGNASGVIGSLNGTLSIDPTTNNVLLTVAVPEPGSVAVLALGAAATLVRRRRRQV